MADSTFRTIDDLHDCYCPALDGILNKIGTNEFGTASSAGYYNRKYGGYVWRTINFGGDILSVIPKVPRIPKIKPKILQFAFGHTMIQEWLAQSSTGDGVNDMEGLRLFAAENFSMRLNQQASLDVQGNVGAGDRFIADEPQNMETIDRIVSSKAEADACSGNGSHWYNPWENSKVDRDSSTKFDSVVKSATGGAIDSGNSRLSKCVIVDTLTEMRKTGGGQPTVCITNWSTAIQVQNLFEQSAQHAMCERLVQFSINGIETAKGNAVGLVVPTLYDIPLITSQWINGDETDVGEKGRMYFLNTTRDVTNGPGLGLSISVPPQYNEIGGVNDAAGGSLVHGEFLNKGIFYSMMELGATRFVGMGKIRDIGT